MSSSSSIEDVTGPQSGHSAGPCLPLCKDAFGRGTQQADAVCLSSARCVRFDGCSSVRFLRRPHMSFAGLAAIAYQSDMEVPKNGSAPGRVAHVRSCRYRHRTRLPPTEPRMGHRMPSQPGFEIEGDERDLETGIRCIVVALPWCWSERNSCGVRAIAAIDPGRELRILTGVSR